MNKNNNWKNFNITMLIIMLIITFVFIFGYFYVYISTRPGYVSKYLTSLPINGFLKKDIVKIEVSTPESSKVVLELPEDIASITSFLSSIKGYKTTNYSSEEKYYIYLYSSKGHMFKVAFSKTYLVLEGQIATKNKRYYIGRNYEIDSKYYDNFVKLLNTL